MRRDRDEIRRRWLFPLALQPVALDHEEHFRWSERAERRTSEIGEAGFGTANKDALTKNRKWSWGVRLRTWFFRRVWRWANERVLKHAAFRAGVAFRHAYSIPKSVRVDSSFLQGPAGRALRFRDPEALVRAWRAHASWLTVVGPHRLPDDETLQHLAIKFLELVETQENIAVFGVRSPPTVRLTSHGEVCSNPSPEEFENKNRIAGEG